MADQALPSPLEFFETPHEAVAPLIPHISPPRLWVDLGCGRGALGKALFDAWGVQGVGVEFLPERAQQALNSGAYAHVIRGDIADKETWTRVVDAANLVCLNHLGREAGWFVISNPPFQQWEIFADRAEELTRGEFDESALLLPSMAFEKKKTRSNQNAKRARHMSAANVGRYDLAERPAFWRLFLNDKREPYVDRKGTAFSTYSWLTKGAKHAGKWCWLEGEVPR